ncbi:unnamed protein product [Penicillium olsonii]|nr:unnamed protein product [Penicillium olsonii]
MTFLFPKTILNSEMADSRPLRLFCTFCHGSGHTVDNCWHIRNQAVFFRHLLAPSAAPAPASAPPKVRLIPLFSMGNTSASNWADILSQRKTRRGTKGRAKRLERERRSALGPGGGSSSSLSLPLRLRDVPASTRGEKAPAPAVEPPRCGSRASRPDTSPIRPSGEAAPPSPTRYSREAALSSPGTATRADRTDMHSSPPVSLPSSNAALSPRYPSAKSKSLLSLPES